jgi:SAM-dependent methyltransferase
MKKYFEYDFDDKVRIKLIKYYENTSLDQHSTNQYSKSELKLSRIYNLISISESDIVLDIGCSKGFLLKDISSKIKQGVGIDISSNMIKRNRKHNNLNNIRYYVFNGEEINLKYNFSKIFMLDVLEHAFNPDKLIKCAHSNLINSGELIIEVPFSGWLSELAVGKYHQGHLRYYDPTYLSNYLEKNGFKVKKVKTYNSVPFGLKLLKYKTIWKIIDHLINLVRSEKYPYFGEIIVVCEKT